MFTCPRCHTELEREKTRTGLYWVWFDATEFDAIPHKATPPVDELPQEARERLAMMEVERIREEADEQSWAENGADCGWKTIPAIFGLPVECNAPALQCVPWMTWGLTLVTVIISLLAFADMYTAVGMAAFYPGHILRSGGLTLLTSFLLHGGWFHLITNMYFLLAFGDNVESLLGRWRYAALLVAATVAGNLLHVWAAPGSTIPCIGASGGISGIIAFYAFSFPRARLGFYLRYGLCIRWLHTPAYVLFIIWGILQAVGMRMQFSRVGGVSYASHVGGMLVGVLAWGLTSRRKTSART